ncbi:MAG: HAD-IA family hydrolase [Chlamydiae bacterium]|nr:HAD-IA family hydrolase [Chlamydiota bacterium]
MITFILILLAFFTPFSCDAKPKYQEINVVIFDFGKVVAQKNTAPLAQFLESELEISFEEAQAILNQREEALLRSESEKLFFKNIFHNFGKEVPPQFHKKFKQKLQDCICVDQKVMKIIQAFKNRGKKVVLFSNTEKHKADLYKELGLYEPFDLLILSYEIGMRKPHKEAYRFVEEQSGFHPKEYLFIDDKIENIQSAKHHQWNTILFCDADQLEKDLLHFGYSIN